MKMQVYTNSIRLGSIGIEIIRTVLEYISKLIRSQLLVLKLDRIWIWYCSDLQLFHWTQSISTGRKGMLNEDQCLTCTHTSTLVRTFHQTAAHSFV